MNDKRPTVVVVEDDPQIQLFLRTALEGDGCRVAEAATAARALATILADPPALVLLDLGLPDRDGTELIRDLRPMSAVPIVVLSARSAETQKIDALDAGADDYLTKPFGVGELLARVRAVLRRRPPAIDRERATVEFGDVKVDLVGHRVERAGNPVHLTPLEYRLLTLMIGNSGKVLTYRQMLREVWGPAFVDSSHYVRIYVGQLRRKLERDPTRPRHIVTETGIGYRFTP